LIYSLFQPCCQTYGSLISSQCIPAACALLSSVFAALAKLWFECDLEGTSRINEYQPQRMSWVVCLVFTVPWRAAFLHCAPGVVVMLVVVGHGCSQTLLQQSVIRQLGAPVCSRCGSKALQDAHATESCPGRLFNGARLFLFAIDEAIAGDDSAAERCQGHARAARCSERALSAQSKRRTWPSRAIFAPQPYATFYLFNRFPIFSSLLLSSLLSMIPQHILKRLSSQRRSPISVSS
jgi:hypothetical protein